MQRLVYTFENNGTGSRIYSFFGILEYNVPLNITSTLSEARNTNKWDWVSYDFDEPDGFTWELIDDLVKISFLEFDFQQTVHIEINENEFTLQIQGMDALLIRG